MMQGWEGDPCWVHDDCANARLACGDYGRCECYWGWALEGRNCSSVTGWTSAILFAHSSYLVCYLTFLVFVMSTLRMAWSGSPPWLKASLLAMLSGGTLMAAEASIAIQVVLSVITTSVVTEAMIFNLLSGTGLIVYNVGIISIAIVWIDVARSTRRMVAHQAGMSLASKLIASYATILGALLVVLLSLTPTFPHVTVTIYSTVGCLTALTLVLVFGVGTRLLSSRLTDVAAFRSSDLPSPAARSDPAEDFSQRNDPCNWEGRALRDIRSTSRAVTFFTTVQVLGIAGFFFGVCAAMIPPAPQRGSSRECGPPCSFPRGV